jgi:hypothetical protein
LCWTKSWLRLRDSPLAAPRKILTAPASAAAFTSALGIPILVGVTLRILGGQEGASERGEHVGDRDGPLGAVPGRAGAVGGKVVGWVAVVGVPDDRQAVADQPERDQALYGALGAGAGVADAGEMSGVQECGFD